MGYKLLTHGDPPLLISSTSRADERKSLMEALERFEPEDLWEYMPKSIKTVGRDLPKFAVRRSGVENRSVSLTEI
jgi:hypothetical protein